MNIYLIRHTKVKLSNNICYGQSDLDLAESFKTEIDIIRNKLNFSSNMNVYTSPLKRCTILSKHLTNELPIIDKRLLELNFGNWELKEWGSLPKSEFDKWLKNIKEYTIPNGESYLDLYKRSKNFFTEIIKKDHKNIYVISHAGVIRSILSYILKISLERSFIINLDYGKISKIIVNQDKNRYLYNIKYINK
ncbi:MAG: alpha-ribazole phosphatase [Candidatus Lokiarchaeota archaeon]|nr:alpha-ribazole phosphatase [Candidatus Lokiarchaeota archaeon]